MRGVSHGLENRSRFEFWGGKNEQERAGGFCCRLFRVEGFRALGFGVFRGLGLRALGLWGLGLWKGSRAFGIEGIYGLQYKP